MSKKPKKQKFKPLDLAINMSAAKPTEQWADVDPENESNDVNFDQINQLRQNLPSAPKASRAQDEIAKISSDPPFKAYVGNIPFDAEEEAVRMFFKKLSVLSVKLVCTENKMRGYGYVEFETRDNLIEALSMTENNFLGRKIRIDLATTNDREDGRGGYGRGRNDRSDREQRPPGMSETSTNWRQKTPRDENDPSGRGNWGDRDRDDRYKNDDDRTGNSNWRSGGSKPEFQRGDRRDDYQRGDRFSKDNDFQRGERRDDRREDRDANSRSDAGSWRSGPKPPGAEERRPPRREEPEPREPRDRPTDGSKERPKLQLSKRTKPVEPSIAETTDRASIFGGAKPVDTATREMQIEKKLEKEHEAILSKVEESDQSGSHVRSSGSGRHDSGTRPRLTSASSGGSAPLHPSLPSRSQRGHRPSEDEDEPTSPGGASHDHHERDTEGSHSRVSGSSSGGQSSEVKRIPAPPPAVNPWLKKSQEVQPAVSKPQTNQSSAASRPSQPQPTSKSPSTTNSNSSREGQNAWTKGNERVVSASATARPVSSTKSPAQEKVAVVSIKSGVQPVNAWARGPPKPAGNPSENSNGSQGAWRQD